jgi:PhoD related phosphatase
MPNIISSAIVNTPPPDTVADLLNRRNKIHHFDADTDEDMVPKFVHDVNGRPRNNKRLLNRRNWCSIRVYDPEVPPPPSSDGASFERNPSPPPKRRGSILRRLSVTRGPRLRADGGNGGNTDSSRPPLTNNTFFGRRSSSTRRASIDTQGSGVLSRTLSLSRKDFMPATLFRRNSKKKPDSGGINGYGAESDDDAEYSSERPARSGIRGGGTDDDERPYPAVSKHLDRMPSYTVEVSSAGNSQADVGLPKGKLARTATSQANIIRRNAEANVNFEGALEISLNVEVNSKDPAGITTPYWLLVPKLWYEQPVQVQEEAPHNTQTGLKRWVSFSGKKNAKGVGARGSSALPSAEKI